MTFQCLFLSGNDCDYECLWFTYSFDCSYLARTETFKPQQCCSAGHNESDQGLSIRWWIVRFTHFLVQKVEKKKKVEVPLPYQSVLQCLQLPLDCLTFFINSQVILFPWQQFPADTKNQLSPWKFKSVVGSRSVFICVQKHHRSQERTEGSFVRFKLLFLSPAIGSWHSPICSILSPLMA